MKADKFFVLDIRHIKETNNPSQIYSDLTAVRELSIPFIPVRIRNSEGSVFGDFISDIIAKFTKPNQKLNNVQIALPRDIDSGLIYKMVSQLRDDYDVKLLGEKHKKQLKFEINPKRLGLSYLTLGRKYKGLGR